MPEHTITTPEPTFTYEIDWLESTRGSYGQASTWLVVVEINGTPIWSKRYSDDAPDPSREARDFEQAIESARGDFGRWIAGRLGTSLES